MDATRQDVLYFIVHSVQTCFKIEAFVAAPVNSLKPLKYFFT